MIFLFYLNPKDIFVDRKYSAPIQTDLQARPSARQRKQQQARGEAPVHLRHRRSSHAAHHPGGGDSANQQLRAAPKGPVLRCGLPLLTWEAEAAFEIAAHVRRS